MRRFVPESASKPAWVIAKAIEKAPLIAVPAAAATTAAIIVPGYLPSVAYAEQLGLGVDQCKSTIQRLEGPDQEVVVTQTVNCPPNIDELIKAEKQKQITTNLSQEPDLRLLYLLTFVLAAASSLSLFDALTKLWPGSPKNNH